MNGMKASVKDSLGRLALGWHSLLLLCSGEVEVARWRHNNTCKLSLCTHVYACDGPERLHTHRVASHSTGWRKTVCRLAAIQTGCLQQHTMAALLRHTTIRAQLSWTPFVDGARLWLSSLNWVDPRRHRQSSPSALHTQHSSQTTTL